ncbi:monovalent cation/H+ antiporter complex subunit F [Aureimonas frigidaquae]|uniref:monovalent cation/H+ antiporter complex subunit F n=1 Tax=Aureimonas frigidaquae TaxID=424757 RepID=UPI0007835626|nr:monovalent cation/H+ antiporter complex subunit F [Aureimonas frigidaquae]
MSLQLDAIADIVTGGLVALLAVPLAMTFWRMVRGPSLADRFVAVDMLTGIAVAIAALTASLTARREFLDVAIGIALMSFVATCAFAAFLERKR